jgi:hypothetical protein
MLVAALTIGRVFFIFTIPLAYWLAGVFWRSGIKSMERQTAWLKRLAAQAAGYNHFKPTRALGSRQLSGSLGRSREGIGREGQVG